MFSLPGTTRQLSRQECTDGNDHALIINPGLMNNNLHMQLILRVFTEPPPPDSSIYKKVQLVAFNQLVGIYRHDSPDDETNMPACCPLLR